MLRVSLGMVALGVLLGGCVQKSQYDALLADAQKAHADLDRCGADDTAVRADDAAARAEVARLNDAVKAAEALVAQHDKALMEARGTARELQAKVDNAIAENAELKKQLLRLGKNADALLAEKGGLSSALTDAKARLEELRKAQAAAAARAQLYKDVLAKFQKMIDAGQLRIALRNGRMVIQLANDVLFDSGQTQIKTAGQQALGQVAGISRTIPDRKFQVAGDTDNVPIHSERFLELGAVDRACRAGRQVSHLSNT